MSFVHLHVHTNYSILEWLWKPKDFVKKAKDLGMEALAITDNWNLYWAFEFYKACKENWINPIIGLEASISKKWIINNKDKDNDFFQIVLLAKNINWYKNLINLVTTSYLEWFYYKPRIDFDLLKKYSGDLIWLSGSYLWEIPQHISTGKKEDFILERIWYYQELFWKEDFYLEIQEHPDRQNQSQINEYILNLSKKYSFKIVATNDSYYINKSDNEAQDLLFCIWDNRSLDDPDRPTLIDWDYSLRLKEEMEELFSYSPNAIKNTLEISQKINIEIPYWKMLLPNFELQENEKNILLNYRNCVKNDKNLQKLSEEEWFLRYLCINWLNIRYDFWFDQDMVFEFIKKIQVKDSNKHLSEMSFDELKELSKSYYTEEKIKLISNLQLDQQQIIERMEYELTVVNLMWFNWYFIIVADFINWAKQNDVPVWPGRWSVAGWLIAFLSLITDIDPLKYWLLFERFLNPARVTMPDIDVDFSDEWRSKVIDYVKNKYWHDHVAQICTFGTMAARAAVKDIWRVLWVSFSEMNDLAKLIPARPWIKIKDALEESTEFKNIYNSNEKYKKIIDNAIKLEWSVRQLWVHACAVIIAPEKITNFCPLQNPPKDNKTVVTQLSQYPIEDLGLLKMDFLWLRNLTIIKRCLAIIKRNHNKDIDLLKISYEDKKTFKTFSEWDTTWVFQFESNWMKKYLKLLKPNTFEDIIAMVALYRPWPW
jgi:DNA polymerase III subunit alpha